MKVDVRECEAGPVVDAACARARGRTVRLTERGDGKLHYEAFYEKYGHVSSVWLPVGDYSTMIGAAWELVEAVAADKKLREAFIDAMWELLDLDRYEEWDWDSYWIDPEAYWLLMTASPLDRCRAFLLAHGVTELEVE